VPAESIRRSGEPSVLKVRKHLRFHQKYKIASAVLLFYPSLFLLID